MENPTVAEAMQQITAKIREGAQRPIDEDALTVVPTRYTASFQTRLGNAGAWDRDGKAVLEAARQLGVIAAAISALRREPRISKSMMEHAADVVQKECSIGFQEGRWCVPA